MTLSRNRIRMIAVFSYKIQYSLRVCCSSQFVRRKKMRLKQKQMKKHELSVDVNEYNFILKILFLVFIFFFFFFITPIMLCWMREKREKKFLLIPEILKNVDVDEKRKIDIEKIFLPFFHSALLLHFGRIELRRFSIWKTLRIVLFIFVE